VLEPTPRPPGPGGEEPGVDHRHRVASARGGGPSRGPRTSQWAATRARWQRAWQRLSDRRYFDLALVTLLVALSLGLRYRELWTSYWGDEAIAIGIASQPVSSLPHFLVNDGSPPLYYLMLHYWMALFGRSELATHILSMVPALAAVPAAWWSGAKLFGHWAARAAAALVATCAYLDYYATETRMYSWLVLVAILAITCFVLAFREGGRRYWAASTVLMAAALYLQYYSLYLLFATALTGVAGALRCRSRARLRATVLYTLACAAAFAPWAPQFLFQVEHTGAPWAPHPTVLDFFGDAFNALASAGWPGVVFAIGAAVLVTKWAIHPARTPALAFERELPSALALATAVPLVTLVTAWLGAQLVNSWNPRYLGIAVVPVLVALAGGLARARWRSVAALVAVLAMAATAIPVLVDRPVTVETRKSDVAYLLGELRPQLHRGALVISAEVTDTPVVALDLGKGYRYATPFGPLASPLVVDWSGLPTRLQKINAATNLGRLLASVPVGGQVLLVNPTTWSGSETPERYAGPVEAEGIAANGEVVEDPDLMPEETLVVPSYSVPLYPMTVKLFIKVRAASGR